MQDTVEHVVAEQWRARQFPDLVMQPPQVKPRAVLDVRLAAAVDLGVRPENLTQHRRVAAHVA